MSDTLTGCRHEYKTEREIILTVPWQDNTCRRCGSTDITTEQEA